MTTANLTGETLRFRGEDGRIHAWPPAGRYTLRDCQSDPNQGVELIVPREAGTLAELDDARQACDQYFSVPIFDEDGLLVAVEGSEGRVTPVSTHCSFKYWRDRTLIVAVGSVDGVMTAAALSLILRAEGNSRIDVVWTQPHWVDAVEFPDNETLDIWLVDLAVDMGQPERTARLLERIDTGGHRLCGVVDEHDPVAWEALLGGRDLRVRPMRATSSGLVLTSISDLRLPAYVEELCLEADCADRGDLSGGRRATVNAAIKSKITDNDRRTACFEWLSGVQREGHWVATGLGVSTRVPRQVAAWAREYEELEEARSKLLDQAEVHEHHCLVDLGGFVTFRVTGDEPDAQGLDKRLDPNGPPMWRLVGTDPTLSSRDNEVMLGARWTTKSIPDGIAEQVSALTDITALCFAAYDRWPGKVIVLRTIVDGEPVSIFGEKVAREARGLDAVGVLATIGQSGIAVRGIPGRATVARDDEAKALEAVLAARRS